VFIHPGIAANRRLVERQPPAEISVANIFNNLAVMVDLRQALPDRLIDLLSG
jgi:hypothetical protein